MNATSNYEFGFIMTMSQLIRQCCESQISEDCNSCKFYKADKNYN